MNRIFRSNLFPSIARIILLVAFIGFAAIGFSANTGDPAFAKILRNTNLGNLTIWSLWWPLVILTAIFLGRVWCMVCPVELVSALIAPLGLKRKPPNAIRSGWVGTLYYLAILVIGIQILSIHRIPFRMGIYLVTLFATAIISALLFERNTFCRHICPVGHLLGLYARLAPFGWGVRNKDVCTNCTDHSCTASANAYRFQGRSCGVGLTPASINNNTDCLLCGQCVKACDRNKPKGSERPNPGWFRRRWFKDLLTGKPLTAAQTTFCVVVSGFVIYEILAEWSVSKEILLRIPEQINTLTGATTPGAKGLVKSLFLFAGLPLLLWLMPYGALRLTGSRLALGKYFSTFGLAFLPIIAAGHAVKALLKISSRIPYWPLTVGDPIGIETATLIQEKTLELATLPGWTQPVLTALMIGLFAVGIGLSFRLVKQAGARLPEISGPQTLPLYLIPILYGGIFVTTILYWKFT